MPEFPNLLDLNQIATDAKILVDSSQLDLATQFEYLGTALAEFSNHSSSETNSPFDGSSSSGSAHSSNPLTDFSVSNSSSSSDSKKEQQKKPPVQVVVTVEKKKIKVSRRNKDMA